MANDSSLINKAGFSDELTDEQLAAIEQEYDEVSRSRPVTQGIGKALSVVAVVFALYHFITAGFGLPVDYWHMGWHLCGLFVLIYAFFPVFRSNAALTLKPGRYRPGNIPLHDWLCMILGCMSALYVGLAWRGIDVLGIQEQTFRQGNPNNFDIFFGTVLIILVLDMARRTLGWILPMIIGVFIAYALLGKHIPIQILQHPGTNWRQFVNNMYFPAEGIFGVTLWVVSTIVFLGLLWNHLRLIGCQYRFDRRTDHTEHEKAWLPCAFRWRCRSGLQRRWSNNTAYHGSCGFHHG